MSQTPSFCPEGEEVKKMEVNTNTKKRGPYLPRELRIKIYNDVIALRQQGRSYNEIRMIIRQKYGVWISKAIISQWVRGLHSPYNGRRIPSIEMLEPSEDLAYIVGVGLGDGTVYVKRGIRDAFMRHNLYLKAKDKEFVEEFAIRVGRVLNRPPPKVRFKRSTAGPAGFEPATYRLRAGRSAWLSYGPNVPTARDANIHTPRSSISTSSCSRRPFPRRRRTDGDVCEVRKHRRTF
jgi:hypothetical protein